jgi:hypothetical protein
VAPEKAIVSIKEPFSSKNDGKTFGDFIARTPRV